jgi:hypothetical protein
MNSNSKFTLSVDDLQNSSTSKTESKADAKISIEKHIAQTNEGIGVEKKKVMNKGELLEYRIKRLLFYMGYFPKIGILLRTHSDESSDMITDLDVYGVYVHKNFTTKNIWADCKSGQARTLERISWLSGVKKFANIDDVLFVKKDVCIGTKEFARKLSIQVLNLGIINKLEDGLCIDSKKDWRGSWNPETQKIQLSTFRKINAHNEESFKKIGNFYSSTYWVLDNYSKIKKTITALRQLSEFMQMPFSIVQTNAIKWMIYEFIGLFVLAVLDISKEIRFFSDKEKTDFITNGLISGEIPIKKREEIVEATYRVAHSIILNKLPEFNAPIAYPPIAMQPPKYTESFCDLVLRVTNAPINYFDILRFLDFLFMEYEFESKEVNENAMRALFSNYTELVVGAKTIIHFVCGVTGIGKNLFQFIR